MLFFSSEINGFIQRYGSLFGLDDEMDEDEDMDEENSEDGNRQGDGDDGKNEEGDFGYGWFAIMKEVSDMTKIDWERCWQLTIGEFFTYLSFTRAYNERQEQMLKEYKAKNGIK